eukprot:jgi/Phyca11/81566/gw1.3.1187.1
MLDFVEARLPFGAEQWQSLASILKRKFLGLKNKRKPTGDPDCPEQVRRAKRVFRQIEYRCAVAILYDSDS